MFTSLEFSFLFDLLFKKLSFVSEVIIAINIIVHPIIIFTVKTSFKNITAKIAPNTYSKQRIIPT